MVVVKKTSLAIVVLEKTGMETSVEKRTKDHHYGVPSDVVLGIVAWPPPPPLPPLLLLVSVASPWFFLVLVDGRL